MYARWSSLQTVSSDRLFLIKQIDLRPQSERIACCSLSFSNERPRPLFITLMVKTLSLSLLLLLLLALLLLLLLLLFWFATAAIMATID